MEEDTNLKIPSELLEPAILAQSLHDLSFFLKIKQYLDTSSAKNKSYFTDQKYQKIFNLICKWYDKYIKFPTINEMNLLVDRLYKEDEDYKNAISATINKVYQEDVTKIDVRYIEEETKNFIKENRIYEAMMMSQISLENKNYGDIVNLMTKAVQVNFDKDLGISIKDIDEAYKSLEQLNSITAISTGYNHLDTVLDGGFRGREMYVLSAIPGLGKCCKSNVKITIEYEVDENGNIL